MGSYPQTAPEVVDVAVPPQALPEVVGRSPGQLAWRRFRKDRTGVVAGFVVLFFFVIAFGAPLIAKLYGKNPYDLYGQNRVGLLNEYGIPIKPNGGMDGEFWFGLEPTYGRDVFTQLLYGIRTSLMIALAVVLIVTVLGTLVGIAAGYLGGWFDFAVGRVIDVLLAMPSQLFFIAFTPVVMAQFVSPEKEPSALLRGTTLVIVLCIFGWCRIARVLRGQVLSLREREFVEAAKVSGAGTWRIVFRELLPNLWTPILVVATLDVPAYVTIEAGLSFLGVGMGPRTPDWGRMIGRGGEVYASDITYLAFPAIAMLLFVLAFNLLGDSVRDALDPKSNR
ncbi:ABC transporter permease [Yinghuangia seranimata]|uniref:ABC transporter permease n=1 Tax=Yinghuangia seranimata TaxID=408067 RepID=UPI00248AE857|nr:ABC transporter permease [Yinghuangia seranimata]MDI2128913.1 ABC transporter permease [Yinghuangia seranimata]